jgi:hypothetical protein
MKLLPTRSRWLLIALVVFALAVRLFGLDFDQSHHFHPDERRIAEAVTQLSLHPLQLNPHFFAYGSFPCVTKLATAALSIFLVVLVVRCRDPGQACPLGALGAATVLLLALLGRRLYQAGGLLAGSLLHDRAAFRTPISATTCPSFLVLAASPS